MSTIVDLLNVIFELRVKNENLETENKGLKAVIDTLNKEKKEQ